MLHIQLMTPEMEALDIPFKLIWGETDPYLNTGVRRASRVTNRIWSPR